MRPERIDVPGCPLAAMCRFAAAIFFMVITLASANPSAAVPPQNPADPLYSAQTFVHELQRLKQDLDGAAQSKEQLRALRESLPKEWAVESGGRRYAVPSELLAARLLQAEKEPHSRSQEIDQARNYLVALATETATLSAQSPPSTTSARSTLDAILARPEYHRNREKSWWEKLRERIDELIFNALERLLGHVGGQKPLGYALLWIGFCAAAILIAYWIFRRWHRAARVTEMDLQAAALPVRSWQEWIFAARESAGRGDYRGAIHYSYWAGIARLQELGALAPDRAKTPREYLGALGKSKVLQPETFATSQHALSQLTARLETVWYGYHIATEADFRDSLARLETLGCHLP